MRIQSLKLRVRKNSIKPFEDAIITCSTIPPSKWATLILNLQNITGFNTNIEIFNISSNHWDPSYLLCTIQNSIEISS
uniref:Putative ovule protein n=1 Tax=Solanum chacoense TaxID=4108 RepID=A0A0V0HDL2_SOLCH